VQWELRCDSRAVGEVKRYQEPFEFDPQQVYEGVDAAKIAADILTVRWAMYSRGS